MRCGKNGESMVDAQNPSSKPDRVTTLAVMTLVSGILNLFWSAGVFLAVVAFGFSTLFVGCLCLPLGIYPLILGIVEIVYAGRLLRSPISPETKPAYYIAVMEIIDMLFGNIVALVTGVLALIFYNDPLVRRYFGEA
jgi:hypothetical protein